ncbi:hypothetical protein KDW82_15250 [Burkholderia vietnamiensis]|uniref:hypothetical protein n=1 Tax=Burkholderia vietnamiensis TaxID=60552 RepID=UPI00158A9521|nr:hypothetical protein [Burkholderia vietnamiensis]MBR8190411.1 hypothetical protein [Burkholderia vietnamiensis]
MLGNTLQVRVEEIRDEAHGIRSFRIMRADGQPFECLNWCSVIDRFGLLLRCLSRERNNSIK